MSQSERKRLLGALLGLALSTGLLLGVEYMVRPRAGAPPHEARIALRQVGEDALPAAVREAAARLTGSQVAYVIPGEDLTYLVIAAGQEGAPLALAEARRSDDVLPVIEVHLKRSEFGVRLLVAELGGVVAAPGMIRFRVDGEEGDLPRLINREGLPLVPLPDGADLVVLSPEAGARVSPGRVVVTGYARLPEGRLHLRLTGSTAAELLVADVRATASSPDWGSFRVELEVPAGVSGEGVLTITGSDSGAVMATIPVRFGSK